jgi:hypothetical protein
LAVSFSSPHPVLCSTCTHKHQYTSFAIRSSTHNFTCGECVTLVFVPVTWNLQHGQLTTAGARDDSTHQV